MPDGVSLFAVGDRFEVRQVITPEQMLAFRALSGDDNPMHLDDTFAAAHGFSGRIAYGNLLGTMLSRLIGTALPTREVLIVRETLDFRQPAYVGDEIQLRAEVMSIHEGVRAVQFRIQFHAAQPDPICTGQCLIKCL